MGEIKAQGPKNLPLATEAVGQKQYSNSLLLLPK
jgi:hypothetical protein